MAQVSLLIMGNVSHIYAAHDIVKKSDKNLSEKISNEDIALFRAAVVKVKPLAESNRIAPEPTHRNPLLRTTNPTNANIKPPLSPELQTNGYSSFSAKEAPTEYLSNGLSRMDLRKLRQRHNAIQARLDLHGLHINTARKLLLQFLHGSTHRGLRCVLVIHGKGMNSRGGEAVLRKHSRQWLIEHASVLAFCDAPAREGGSGAALVLLRNIKAIED